ncbi:MAG: hypothetical protein IIU39_04865 [Ruminococcus sp.]|nr:hypothetical protein [Ruminococcus sp.]
MDKLLFKRIIIGILSVLIVSYIVYLIVSANFVNAVQTEEAVSTTVSDEIHTKAFIVREESYVKRDSGGVLSYNIDDGDDVSGGQTIADIYRNENDAVSRKQIDAINKQIKNLQSLSQSYYKNSVGLDTINSQISNNIFTISEDVNNGKLIDANSSCENLLFSICERQITTGTVRNFNSKINELRTRRNKIKNNCSPKIGTLSSPKAGYFITSCDGYEKSVNSNNLKEFGVKKFNKIKKKNVPKNVIGKIVTNPNWYVTCKVSPDDAVKLSNLMNNDVTVSISMPNITSEKIPSYIYSINQKSRKTKGVLVLRCDYMNKYIANARSENTDITTVSYTGLKVSKRAIHEDYVEKTVKDKKGKKSVKRKKVQGVYVLHGSELLFKEISISYSAKDYVLCEPNPNDGVLFSNETLQLYDQVVVKGDNLYDGKIIH